VLNLESHIAAVDAMYAGANARLGPLQEVVFEGREIQLAVPKEGIVMENGWTITPLTHPGITKHQVDQFIPGRRVPSCQLDAKWTGQQEQPVQLEHVVELLGVKEPNNFFVIRIPPPQESVSRFLLQLLQHQLSIQDLADITIYLHPLDRTAVLSLGLVLGLDYSQLMPLRDSPDFLADMLAGWLQRVDQVQKAGVPTWNRLVEALRNPRVGHNAIASNIEWDKL